MLYPYALSKIASSRGRRADRLAGIIACAILLFFMAARANTVGVDTKYYYSVFAQFRNIPWKKTFSATLYSSESLTNSFSFRFEVGYRLINQLLSCFTHTPQAITILNSILVIVPLYYVIKENSPTMMLSIWLYITLGIYQSEMNITRNAIAVLICYMALQWVKAKKPTKYVVCVLLASTIHQTALLLLPIYWLVHYVRLNKKRITFLIVSFAFVGLNLSFVAHKISFLLPYQYARYLSGKSFSISSVLVGVFSAVLLLVVRYFMSDAEWTQATQALPIGTWMFTLNMCFFGINLGMEAGARLAALFGPYAICYLPQMITQIQNKRRRYLATIFVFGASFLQYVIRLKINNIGGTMPYHFFWSI